MNLLALETATDTVSIGLLAGGVIATQTLADAGARSSERILAELSGLLAGRGLRLKDFDAIAYDCGPGAFTALRSGCAIAKALALAAELPMIAVSSLEALAAGETANKVWAALDARMGGIYAAGFVRTRDGWRMETPILCRAPADMRVEGEGWVGVGTGFAVADGALVAANPGVFAEFAAERIPDARGLLTQAELKFAAGLLLDPAAAQLTYVRDKVALTTREREQART
ncbi:MAG: tRNA (adenosine(37)-N6)-threonylcarbamoyltransferase complex dimerization subunit type 1 TsaB [Betaproteobacteria bacterium]|nr:tRNA (adenosine(37)-N6)-threonylcarbamoyltransferase complex dimerization subunit type 1 TsaB [Betaproteobacteria bacterium]